mgnify:CR=1 FL=1
MVSAWAAGALFGSSRARRWRRHQASRPVEAAPTAAPSVGVLADAVVEVLRHLTGYDRVVVYKFDPDGHGRIIAEARHPRLESLLGLRGAPVYRIARAWLALSVNSARPLLGQGNYRGAFENLYLCGSGTHPGGGVTGLPGRNAAREILKDLGRSPRPD